MDNRNSRGKHWEETEKYGNIFIKLDKEEYYEGEQLNGEVYIDLVDEFPGNELFLRLKGKEVVHFVESESRMRTRSDGTQETYYEQVLRTDQQYNMNYHIPTHQWTEHRTVGPGQYIVPFSTKLPSKLPSSYFQKMNRALASIEYSVDAMIKPHDRSQPSMLFKHRFLIKSKGDPRILQDGGRSTKGYSTCCISKGESEITCKFEKSYYIPGEAAKLLLQINNTRSKIGCSGVKLDLKQHLELRVQGREKSFTFNVVHRDLPAVPAGQVSETQLTSLQLPTRQAGDYAYLKHDDRLRDLLVEEPLYANSINPSTNGESITSRLTLTIRAYMEGFGHEDNVLQMPCYITLPPYEIKPEVRESDSWRPETLETKVLSLRPLFEVKKASLDQRKSDRQTQRTSEDGKVPSYDFDSVDDVVRDLNLKTKKSEKKILLDNIDMTTSVTVTVPSFRHPTEN